MYITLVKIGKYYNKRLFNLIYLFEYFNILSTHTHAKADIRVK